MPETSATRGGMLHVSRSTHETKPAAAGRHSLARRADKDRALSKCFTIYTNLHTTIHPEDAKSVLSLVAGCLHQCLAAAQT